MFWIIILNKAVAIWKNVLDKGSQGLPQNGNEQWGIHFAFKDRQSRPATTTDTCPDMHLHRMLELGLIVWFASSLLAACAPVSFHLHRKDNVLKSIVLILFGLRKSLLLIHFPNHLAVFFPLAVHPKSFLHRRWIPPMHQIRQLASSVAIAPSLWFHHSSLSGL